MIAVDWGTTNFRAFRLGADGTILDRRTAARGILHVEAGAFAAALQAEIGDWLAGGERHVLLCGMIGSRQGWQEVPYLRCPAGAAELAGAVATVAFAGAELRLVPGVTTVDVQGVPDVMRGEETKIVGALDALGGSGLVCLPGTHAKWVRLQERRIAGFTTHMTGEVFGALREHTILGRMMHDAPLDTAAFDRGVARSADSGGLLHHLFGVRALGLMGGLAEDAAPSYLSGLLIGTEVRSALTPGATVHLIGAEQLSARYARAITACGGTVRLEDEDAAARGLAAIARSLDWL
jgi:2-dehydro-3-deoxygalactonokinase